MNIWAIADLHLALTLPEKDMSFFGPSWKDYVEKISTQWKELVSDNDLVLIAGDISWAMKLDEAKEDLAWIDSLPGKKVLLKGNHDYWWPTSAKLEKLLPPSISFVYSSAFTYKGVAVAGARLWDHPEINYSSYITFQDNPRQKKKAKVSQTQIMATFEKELLRLERTLKTMPDNADLKIVMTHYPPVDEAGTVSSVTSLLKQYGINICVFGHLHNVNQAKFPSLCFDQIPYYLTSADFLNFKPIKIATL
ncbi:phosphoesterase [Candidatus Aerophobetes bacterium]|uniref:Phosphoesterase n=1 Tax=Aerophobetes bacterium TaxID=2030807 RepID=A0A2A4X5G1_UNCAE|nr:MAG: phosphoesterase [Candidatus Aerophobetes bacterium]